MFELPGAELSDMYRPAHLRPPEHRPRQGARPPNDPAAGPRRPSLLLGAALAAAPADPLDRLFPPDLSRMRRPGRRCWTARAACWRCCPPPAGSGASAPRSDDVSRPFLDLLVATEDRRFWQHPGVDPLAIVRAAAQWIRAGRVVSGGSTLSMQAARLLEPRPRTLRNKIIEAARALQLEWRFGKAGVLGIWLTLAPYGGNLEGVRAGARAWFGASAAALDPAQAALLVALPRRPEALRPDRHPARAETVRDRVLPEARACRCRSAACRFPATRPRRLQARRSRVCTGPPCGRRSTCHCRRRSSGWWSTTYRRCPSRASLAILVADARSREIRAAVSGRWGDEARAGDMDLTRAVRSPGSALKPFLYSWRSRTA